MFTVLLDGDCPFLRKAAVKLCYFCMVWEVCLCCFMVLDERKLLV